MLPLFEQMKEIMKDTRCPACQGDGYEREMKDSDSMMKVLCQVCDGTGGTVEEEREYATAKQRKEKGIEKMNKKKSAQKLDRIFNAFLNMWVNPTFTSQDVRWFAERTGEANDVKPNAWGSLFNRFGKSKRIEKTGRYVKSQRPESHAREVAEWRISK